ncbi:MAG: MerR family transcriptional regulator [Muribaculaceae bacterium]|nr:MerR family transcriptional regulator [Muribaculaceae bacterium]
MNDLTKKYYKISEVADIIGIPPSTLRFWESQFTIVKPHRNAKGTRYYTPKDIETIRMVYFLVKEKGLRLDAAQEELKRNHTGISRRFQAIERLREIRGTLQQMLDSLYVRR